MTWDGIRGTLQWMLLLLLIGLIAVGATAFHFWSQKDAFIHQTVDQKLSEVFPTCEVTFQSVQIVDASQISLTKFHLRSKSDGATLIQIPRVIIYVDPGILQETRKVVLKRIVFDSPQVFAMRDENGRWNWDSVTIKKSEQDYSAAIQVKNGEIQIGLRSLENGPLHTVNCRGVEFSMSPEAMQRYQISGDAIVESMGAIKLEGLYDSNSGEWNIAGHAGELRIDEPLLEHAGKFIPEVEARLAQIKQTPQFLARNGTPFQTASSSTGSTISNSARTNQSSPTESLLRADLDLHFSLGKKSPTAPLDYLVKAKIEHGQVSDLFLPIPLYDLSAYLEVSPDKITIDRFQASNNESSLFIDGEANRIEQNWERQFVVRATNLQIDERIQSILPETSLKIYRLINPSGTFDLDFEITQEPGKAWAGILRKFTAKNCRVVPDHFRQPVEQVQGVVTHQSDRFAIEMNGIANNRPVSLKGFFGAGESRKDFDFTVVVNNFSVSNDFPAAFSRKDLMSVNKTLTSLRLNGLADFKGRFLKTQETGNQFNMQLGIDVSETNMNFVGFPYQLEGLTGRVTFDSLRDKTWRFQEFKGRHGHSVLTADGSFDLAASPGKLNLDIGAIRVPIDGDLEKATLTSNPYLESLWTDFSLAGTLDVEKIHIGWEPGMQAQVSMQGIQWKDGTIKPIAFPYQWNDVVATLEWTGKRLNIHSLHGWHGETYLELIGTDPNSPTFVEIPPNGPIAWETHFGNMMIVKAKFDEDLERALPVSLATTFKAMDLEGNVNVQLRADLRGWTKDKNIVTANWEMQTVLDKNSFFSGVRLDNVTGKVKIRDGLWDGENLRMEGEIEFKEALALGMPFKNIRSPFHMDQSRIIIGAPKFVDPPPQFLKPNEYVGKQLRADLYAGQIGYDALVLLGPRPELTQYKAELNVNDVELAEVAADQSPNARNLKGKVNGIMAYQGIGPSPESIKGKGWVNIVPAAIMDLPAFAQMFALINFRPVGNTAFNYAYGDFGINNGRFEFSRIELRGDALGLIGKGIVGFAAGNQSLINLTFDSRTNNRLPVIGRIIDGIGSNWIRVQVTGTVAQPVPVVQPRIGPMDDAFREFTEAMEKGQNLRPPLRLGTRPSDPQRE